VSRSPYQITYPDGINWNADTVRVSLHTSPPESTTGVGGAGYTRAHGGEITWTSAESVAHAFLLPSPESDDDPYELDMTDATPTGIGDPLADVLRSIDDLLEGQ